MQLHSNVWLCGVAVRVRLCVCGCAYAAVRVRLCVCSGACDPTEEASWSPASRSLQRCATARRKARRSGSAMAHPMPWPGSGVSQ